MIKLDQLKFQPGYSDLDIANEISKQLSIQTIDIESFIILKESVDARKKTDIKFILNVGVCLKNNHEQAYPNLFYLNLTKNVDYNKQPFISSPVVVGFGPCGMFCALALARMGQNPIILEQGKKVDERQADVNAFWKNGELNEFSNVQFGEGGAGTFSDGKLTTNLDNKYCKMVIYELVNMGAPKEILYKSKPHIGSDKLRTIVENIRKEIIALGGKFFFSTKLINMKTKNDKHILSIKNVDDNTSSEISASAVVLAVGHSARDTYQMLFENNFKLSQKPFAMGVRIEHKQKKINESQYGKNYNKLLPPAEYKLAEHLPSGRSAFTFCMCPGGVVIASSSKEGEIVTNGMSNFNRDKENCNSAVLVNVMPADYGSEHPLAGVAFQAKYEKLAYELTKSYYAPVETVGSFMGGVNSNSIKPTYKPGTKFCKIERCLPDFVTASLKEALPLFNKKINGFASPDSILTAIESRSSSPVTIVRDDNFQCIDIPGVFPAGEGAGYAGGITSSAQDGIRVAESVMDFLLKNVI